MKVYFLFSILCMGFTGMGQAITLKLDRKIKGDIWCNDKRISRDTPTLVSFGGSGKMNYDLTDSIVLDPGMMSGLYKIWLEQDWRPITDTIIIEVNKGHEASAMMKVKYFEMKGNDTVNRLDKKWQKQGRWIEQSGEGNYVNDLKQGYWIRQHGVVILDEGWYEKGKEEGVWIRRTFDGNINTTSTYKHGKLNGPYNVYYDNGRIARAEIVKNNLRWDILGIYDSLGNALTDRGYMKNGNGILIRRDTAGSIIEETRFKNGLKDGLERKLWYGQRWEENIYRAGKKIKSTSYYPNSEFKEIEELHGEKGEVKRYQYDEEGRLESLSLSRFNARYYGIYFYENGRVKEKGPFRYRYLDDGMYESWRDGKWIEYNDKGRPVYEVIYKRDKEVSRKPV